MKVIIAGTRDFPLHNYVPDGNIGYVIYESPFRGKITEVVCGCSGIIDECGAGWAWLFEKKVKKFPPDWNKYGKAAGPIRNKQMAEYADAAIVVWDGKSKGAKNMIDNMEKLGKPVYVFKRTQGNASSK